MATVDSTGARPGEAAVPSGAPNVRRGSGSENGSSVEARALAAIQAANTEFLDKTESHMSLPIAVAIQQRDDALVELEKAKEIVERERERLVAEQDSFIAFLTEDHQRQLGLLEQQVAQARIALERQAALAPAPVVENIDRADDSALARALEESKRRIDELQEQLENAYNEVDESRKDGWRLQEERDEAIRATDDLRVELLNQLDLARDEIVRLELERDEASRLLEDARDQAREEQCRLIEELETAKSELDERRGEVTRLRERLEASTEDYRPSRLPPPPNNAELERARAESTVVRKQLVETKREVARLTRELELARGPQRAPMVPRPTPAGGLRMGTRTGTTAPGLPAVGRPAEEEKKA